MSGSRTVRAFTGYAPMSMCTDQNAYHTHKLAVIQIDCTAACMEMDRHRNDLFVPRTHTLPFTNCKLSTAY